ncbi:glycosyltransferase [Natrinema sp. CGMCC1.2065]|uniref:glycosyltransferase n=1 Tax=Natrinema sp. CGMCC1.2065 TaxID=3445767 RepID=UPI003F4A5911
MSDSPRSVSVVCATYERPVDTVELVSSLKTAVDAYDTDEPATEWFECIIVYPRGDPAADRLERIEWEPLHSIESDRSEANANRDRGISAADCEYIAILDSDVVVASDWMTQVQAALASRSGTHRVIQGAYYLDYPPERNWVTETEAIADEFRFRGGQLDSRNLVLSRKVYFDIGGFETERENADAATDLLLLSRLKEHGIVIEHHSEIRAYHKYPRTIRGNCHRFYRYGRGAVHIQRRRESLFREQFSPGAIWRRGFRDAAHVYLGREDPHDRLQITYILVRFVFYTVGYLQERQSTR